MGASREYFIELIHGFILTYYSYVRKLATKNSRHEAASQKYHWEMMRIEKWFETPSALAKH